MFKIYSFLVDPKIFVIDLQRSSENPQLIELFNA